MLSMHSEQLHKTGFPTVHAVVLLEGTMNLTGETQPLVEQLMMVKRMQVGGQGGALSPQRAGHAGQEGGFFWSSLGVTGFLLLCGGSWIPVLVVLSSGVALPSHLPSLVLAQESGRCLCCLALTCRIPKGRRLGWDGHPLLAHPRVFPQHIPTPLFVLEIWKACFVGLIESPEGTGELKWTAFTFLKVPGLWEPVLGRFSGGAATPWTFAPGFSPPASCLACPVPHYPKAPRLFCPLGRAFPCLGTQVP